MDLWDSRLWVVTLQVVHADRRVNSWTSKCSGCTTSRTTSFLGGPLRQAAAASAARCLAFHLAAEHRGAGGQAAGRGLQRLWLLGLRIEAVLRRRCTALARLLSKLAGCALDELLRRPPGVAALAKRRSRLAGGAFDKLLKRPPRSAALARLLSRLAGAAIMELLCPSRSVRGLGSARRLEVRKLAPLVPLWLERLLWACSRQVPWLRLWRVRLSTRRSLQLVLCRSEAICKLLGMCVLSLANKELRQLWKCVLMRKVWRRPCISLRAGSVRRRLWIVWLVSQMRRRPLPTIWRWIRRLPNRVGCLKVSFRLASTSTPPTSSAARCPFANPTTTTANHQQEDKYSSAQERVRQRHVWGVV